MTKRRVGKLAFFCVITTVLTINTLILLYRSVNNITLNKSNVTRNLYKMQIFVL